MSYIHHGSIRKYTAVLLDIFNDLEVQYNDSLGNVISRNVPVKFSSVEKSKMLDEYTVEQIISGNYNVLPKGTISLEAVQKAEQRITNKNVKINTVKNEDFFEFQYNSVPYEFMFQLIVRCRGMNEATMIIEQIAPKFNPTLNVDVYDGINLTEPTRIPIKLLDFAIDNEDYEEFSSNIVTVSCSISIQGNLYPPIKTLNRIKDFKIQLNEQKEDTYNKKVILGWDVNDSGELINESITIVNKVAPTIIDIITNDLLTLGENSISVIYEDKDSLITELEFEWEIITGDASITFNKENAILTLNSNEVEVQVKITDYNKNYTTLNKVFTL